MHQLKEGRPRLSCPAGGLVTALDPVLQSCGGLWVAHGAGEADRETADERGRISVPPDDPRYTLRRVWLTREEEQGYYYGFSNEGLWPLCHLAHERPQFRAPSGSTTSRANRRFADAVLEEIGAGAGHGAGPGLPARARAPDPQVRPPGPARSASSGTSPGPTPRRSASAPSASRS